MFAEINDSNDDGSVLYEKEASFVAVLDDSAEYQSDQPHPESFDSEAYSEEYPEAYMPRDQDKYSANKFEDKRYQNEAFEYDSRNDFKSSYNEDVYDDSNYEGSLEEPRVLPDTEEFEGPNAGKTGRKYSDLDYFDMEELEK